VPKLSETAKKNKAAYDKQYQHENVSRLSIFFNKGDEEDQKILGWLEDKGRGNKSGYVKGLIREDMQKAGK
jgi:hypothetical protein